MRAPQRDVGQDQKRDWRKEAMMSLTEWAILTPQQRVIHYNRNLVAGCPHEANIMDWPEDLWDSFSFDPGAHVSHIDIKHTVAAFKAGTCECDGCLKNVGLERGSHYEYLKRKKRIS